MNSPRRRSPSPTLKVAGPMALTDEGKPPSPGRGWQGEALTGVGRWRVGLGTACQSSEIESLVRTAQATHLSSGILAAPTGFPIHLGPVLWEGWVPLIRPGLRPVRLKRRGRRPHAKIKKTCFGGAKLHRIIKSEKPLNFLIMQVEKSILK